MLEKFADKDRAYIKTKVETGFYTSEIELVLDAVRRMREREEQQKSDTLRALVVVTY